MQGEALDLSATARDLLALVEGARTRAEESPFDNPILAAALAISRRMDAGDLTEAAVEGVIRLLRDQAWADRAARLAAYVGDTDLASAEEACAALARRLVQPDPSDSPVPLRQYRAAVERTRFAAVFTAHPTFAVAPDVFGALAEAACGRRPEHCFVSHRPERPTLEQEFDQAAAAISRGRDALDRLNGALLDAARPHWPDRWAELIPAPVVLATWVGYDTDGRADIGWWDTLRLRLRMKRLQLARLQGQLAGLPAAGALSRRIGVAAGAVDAQVEACPEGEEPDQVAVFAGLLVGRREEALVTPEPLLPLFAEAVVAARDPAERRALCLARAGLLSHGMALAHTHVRLNAAQLHNAARLRLGLEDPPSDPFRRRSLLAAANAALDGVAPVPVDFGAILAERASATRLMMLVAEVVKHVDGAAPVRFLIAETESGYTLLVALWLARLFGVDRHVEISPLFETPDALEQGMRVVEEALRSPHWRAYLRATGRLTLQFGYSDSGRYVGQLAGSYLVERLRLKVAEAIGRHGLADIEVVLFDTHGESIGRGGHPGSLADRLKYLSPPAGRAAFASAGVRLREESAFQGGDGYLLFGTPELALSTVARIAEHAFAPPTAAADRVYEEADFAAGFFASIGYGMRELVEDPGYAALLGAFGPALLDPTGSRPTARQAEGVAGSAVIRHPRELRAIPNNAILQQLGWCANTLHGLGAAAARHPELFAELGADSPRFRRALDLVRHALAHSDLDVLRAAVALLDPGPWLDRASHARWPGRAPALAAVARALDRLGLWMPTQATFRRVQADHVALRSAWPDAPRMATREALLHALRLALIQRIWLLGAGIPDFSPRHGFTRQTLDLQILRLEVPAALSLLADVFPIAPDGDAERDYAEPRGPRNAGSYGREHAAIFAPMRRQFALVREIGTAITHEVGAFG